MSEVISLKQFNGSTVTPKDDAIMYDAMIGESGLLEGCDLTHTGAGQIRIGAGRGIIKGRQFVVQEHTINVTLSSDSDMPGRVYIRMDLSDTAAPAQILSVTAEILPDLEQDENCNQDNGVYEMELGTYTASKLAISNLEKTISQISIPLKRNEVVDDLDAAAVITEPGVPAGCLALAALYSNLGNCTFSAQEDGAYVTYTPPGGADPVTKKLGNEPATFSGRLVNVNGTVVSYTDIPCASWDTCKLTVTEAYGGQCSFKSVAYGVGSYNIDVSTVDSIRVSCTLLNGYVQGQTSFSAEFS